MILEVDHFYAHDKQNLLDLCRLE